MSASVYAFNFNSPTPIYLWLFNRSAPLIHSVFPPDLWFVVRWLKEQDDLFDVLSAKDVSVEGQEVFYIKEGSEGQGKYRSDLYPVQIIAKGELEMPACFMCGLQEDSLPIFVSLPRTIKTRTINTWAGVAG